MKAEQSFKVKQRRLITAMFKAQLQMLSELKAEHDEFYGNLAKQMPENLLPALIIGNPFSDEKLKRFRKQVLDRGNDIIRDCELEMENYSISFNI